MPKPMLKQPQSQTQTQTRAANILSATRSVQETTRTKQMDQMKLDRLLRKPRSKAYMDAMHKLDSGGHVHNQEKVDQIIQTIREEFPEVELSGMLLGYVSICYLGRPYEVHTLDMSGRIIEHYEAMRPLPNGLERARGIALRGGYEFIEVYIDCCRCISSNGSVSVVKM